MEKLIYRYVAVVAAAMIGVAGFDVVPWTNLKTSDWAAWVQAVGSVAGIFIAVWLPAKARRAESADAADSDLQRLQLLAQQAFQFVQNLRSQMRRNQYSQPTFDDVAFEHIRRGLADLATHRLSPENMARAFKVADLLGELYEFMTIMNKPGSDPVNWKEDSHFFQSLSVSIMRLKKDIEDDMTVRGLSVPDWLAL
ncbi:hypothetical protein [Burkholderia sp. Bp9099]|uniref:hypothetical protein n=1 Tax=Burkholderia sp. Bp9099 TaxID=2184568 RepID=UPI000F5FF30D|nr:hypothetical protein [Burkholderia sp. Bp9099]RQZ50899.1 hypothetical protein DIE17_03745 [Burkholderia sp. Bp9099]